MKSNLKNIALGALGLLILGLFGAFVSVSTETSQVGEVGRYTAIVDNDKGLDWRILDTKTGRVYFYNDDHELVYVDWVKGARSSK